jgi:hypothetical protein
MRLLFFPMLIYKIKLNHFSSKTPPPFFQITFDRRLYLWFWQSTFNVEVNLHLIYIDTCSLLLAVSLLSLKMMYNITLENCIISAYKFNLLWLIFYSSPIHAPLPTLTWIKLLMSSTLPFPSPPKNDASHFVCKHFVFI